jgi:phosphatidylglycerophosphate synthase
MSSSQGRASVRIKSLWTPFGRRSRNAAPRDRELVWTGATMVTLARAVICSVLFVLAIGQHAWSLVLVALITNMVLDTLDGELARRHDHETVFGAQIDGAVDRLVVVLVVAATMSERADTATALLGLVVCLQFALVDHVLSTQFLRFGLWSPDHFYAVDERVWRINWSPVAKLASNVPVVLFVLSPVLAWGALVPAATLIFVRARSYGRVAVCAELLIPEKHYALGPRAPDFESDEAAGAEVEVETPMAEAGIEVRTAAAALIAPGASFAG